MNKSKKQDLTPSDKRENGVKNLKGSEAIAQILL